MSQLEDVNAINDMFARTKPANSTSAGLKASWISWFGKLRPYDKSDSPGTYKEALARRDAFFKADALVSAPKQTPSQTVSNTPIIVPGPRPTLRAGIHKTSPSTIPYVKEWQTVIKVTPDGGFGPQTTAATVTWQRARGLDADGVVGPKSWAQAQLESSKALSTQGASIPAAAVAAANHVAASITQSAKAASTAKTPAAKAAAVSASGKQTVAASASQAATAATTPKPTPIASKLPIPPAVKETVTAIQTKILATSAATPTWMKALAVTGAAFAGLIGFKVLGTTKRRAA